MPIKEISDIRRFMRLGKIRLGRREKAQSGSLYPTKLDYFLVDPYDASLRPRITELYGEKPRRLNIAIPDEDPETVFDQNYECWGQSKLRCRGTGETATRTLDNGTKVECECPGPQDCEFAISHGIKSKDGKVTPGCKRVARLQVVLTDLDAFGIFQVDTGGFNNIVNINSALDMLRRIAGRISWIEVPLTLSPQKATIPETGKQTTIFVMNIPLPVSVKNFAPLTPLIEYANEKRIERLPAPNLDMPTDLIPLSHQLPAPGETSDVIADPETGEICDAEYADDGDMNAGDDEFADHTPEPSLEDDPEIAQMLESFPTGKRKALLQSAQAGGWDREQMITCLTRMMPKGNRATPPPARTQARPPEPEQAPMGDDDHPADLF